MKTLLNCDPSFNYHIFSYSKVFFCNDQMMWWMILVAFLCKLISWTEYSLGEHKFSILSNLLWLKTIILVIGITWLWRWLPHRLSKHQSQTTVLLRAPVTKMIIFNQGMLLPGLNHSFFLPVRLGEYNYLLPFITTLDTKLRELQYKILNRILYTNKLILPDVIFVKRSWRP